MQYIVGPKSNGCILCEKAKGDEDTKNLILARGPLTYVIHHDLLDRGPEAVENIFN